MKKRKHPGAVALGKLGGPKGGKASAARLTPEERSERARKASVIRWEIWRKANGPTQPPRGSVPAAPANGVASESEPEDVKR